MQLNYITIMVRDLEKSVDFYGNMAGLKILRRFNPGPGEIVFMANEEGETMLELIGFPDAEKVSVKGMVVSFAAGEKLEQVREKLLEAGYQPSKITDEGPKPKYFTVSDPDGITVEFSA